MRLPSILLSTALLLAPCTPLRGQQAAIARGRATITVPAVVHTSDVRLLPGDSPQVRIAEVYARANTSFRIRVVTPAYQGSWLSVSRPEGGAAVLRLEVPWPAVLTANEVRVELETEHTR